VPEELHCGEKDLGQGSRAVFWKGDYHEFVKGNAATTRNPGLVVGFNMGLSCPDYDWSATLALLSRSRSPLLTLTNTLPELSMEQEVLEEAGMTCAEALPNIFPCPCPMQSGTVANDVKIPPIPIITFQQNQGRLLSVVPFSRARFKKLVRLLFFAPQVYRKNAWLALYYADIPPAPHAPPSLVSRQQSEKRLSSSVSGSDRKPKKKKKNN
jgi:hypothetical protein